MSESALGSLAMAQGDAPQARRRYLAAGQLYGRARQPYWVARSKVQAALALPGGTPERCLLDEASATFDALGARRPLRAVVAYLESAREAAGKGPDRKVEDHE